MDKANCHRKKLIDFLRGIYVAGNSKSYSRVSVEKRGTSDNQERYRLEFNTSEKSVQEIRCRRRRFSPIIFLIPEITRIAKHVCLFHANYFEKNLLVFSSLQILVL